MSDLGIRGERFILKRLLSEPLVFDDSQWTEVEKIIGWSLPSEAREQIAVFANVYAFVGPMYSHGNTVLATDILPEIRSWLEATHSLLATLKATRKEISSKEQFIAEYLHGKNAKRLAKSLPLQLLVFAAQSAAAVGDFVLNQLTRQDRNLPIQNDLWSAWVCLTAQELEKAGLKISGASTDKSRDECPSPFINVIAKLQSFLPDECQHFKGYESIRKGTQQSIFTMGKMKKTTLIHLMAGWGAQLHTKYPGNLRRATNEKIQEFEKAAQERRDQIRGRLSRKH